MVYDGLRSDSILFEGHVESPKRINLLYDVNRHYHVITNLTGAMAKSTFVGLVIEGAGIVLDIYVIRLVVIA